MTGDAQTMPRPPESGTGAMKDIIPRQTFEVVQAAAGVRLIVGGKIQPLRKNVKAKCYGDDFTRKNTLL